MYVTKALRCKSVIKFLLLFIFVVTALLMYTQNAQADIGPHPEMWFDFEYETSSILSIVKGYLLECNDPACQDSAPLENIGAQGFICTQDSCSSTAYRYSEYHQLEITFSDGSMRESNVFTKTDFSERYLVTVREHDLLVEKVGGSKKPFNPMWLILGGYALVILIFALLAGVLIMLVVMLFTVGRGKTTFKEARVRFILCWLFAAPVIAISSLFSLPLLLTVLIESLVVFIYARIKSLPWFTLLTIVTLANLFTQPVLLLALNLSGGEKYLLFLAIGEICVWLAETVILSLSLRQLFNWKDAALLSLLLNIPTALIGLLLP